MSALSDTATLYVMLPQWQSRHGAEDAEGHAVAGLWRAALPWAPPAGFHDYTALVASVAASLRVGPMRLAAARGSQADRLLGTAFEALSLDAEDAYLDLHRIAEILCGAEEKASAPGALSPLQALLSLAKLGIINLALRDTTAVASNSVLGRRLRLPLCPGKPTLAHLIACRASEHDAAALARRFAALQALGVDLDTASHLGRTPLHLATLSGRVSTISALLEAGARLDVRDRLGRTPLELAARRKHHAAARLLIERGAQQGAAQTGPEKTQPRREPVSPLTEHAA